jgi:hypothetical protein
MTVVRLPVHGQWAWDVRGEGRAVRISAHVEAGLVNLSVWRHDTCVGTVRLLPDEVANLVAGLTEGLAQMTVPPVAVERSGEAARLRELEQRLARLESGLASTWKQQVRALADRARGAMGTRAVSLREGRAHRRSGE